MNMSFGEFKDKMTLALGGLLVSIAAFMAKSVWSLNENMAVIVERVQAQSAVSLRHELEMRDMRNRCEAGCQKD